MTHRREFLRFVAGSPVLAALGLDRSPKSSPASRAITPNYVVPR